MISTASQRAIDRTERAAADPTTTVVETVNEQIEAGMRRARVDLPPPLAG
jgi:hypothetical protein